jgi:hypothetical protein
MRVTLFPATFLAVCIFGGFVAVSSCYARDAEYLAGEWQTHQMLPRLGDAAIKCTLNSDGTFRLDAHSANALSESLFHVSGKYLLDSDRGSIKLIVIKPRLCAVSYDYVISCDILAFMAGSREIIRFRRKWTTI